MTTTVRAPAPTQCSAPLRIFLSYGHDEFAEIAARLWQDLRARGHEVWFDRADLHSGSDWERTIEEAIDWVGEGSQSGCVILLMTPHSVRRPDGYCLNEITRAVSRRIRIVPVMVVDVEPPLSITRIQWLDLRDCVPLPEHETPYERKLPLLLTALEQGSLDFEGTQAWLYNLLAPVSYDKDIEDHVRDFVGRKWLFRDIDDWLANRDAPPVFLIVGGPGSGKSAIAAWLCARRPEVRAFHMCRFSDRLKADPSQAVRSIAWQLSTQLPDYLTRLARIPNLEAAFEAGDASTLFDLLLIQPLHHLPPPDGVVVIVIDAIDEATRAGNNDIARFIGNETDRLPQWLRLVVTTRPEREVMRHLQSFTPIELKNDSEENVRDLSEYITTHIAAFAPGGAVADETVAQLRDVSQGNWLYLYWIARELKTGRLSLRDLEKFPRGLGSVYCQFFERRFPTIHEYEERCRPLLELVVASCEPPLVSALADLLRWTSYELQGALREFGSLLKREGESVCLFHRSLADWLLDPSASDEYMVDPQAGHIALADAGWREYEDGVAQMRDYTRRWLPTHLEAVGRVDDLTRFVTDARCVGQAFLDGRHLELAHFWTDAASPAFASRCDASYALVAREGECELLRAAARGIGQLFLHCGVYPQARTYLERALMMSRSDEATGFAHLDIGWCLRQMEAFDAAIAHADEAIESFRVCANRGGEGRAESIKGICLWHLQDDLTALHHLALATSLCGAAGDARGEHEALNHMGIVRRGLGQYEDALECLHRAEAFFGKIKDARALGKVCNSLGTAYWWSGRYDPALEYYRRADAHNLRTNQNYVAGLTANNLGYLHIARGEYDEARDAFRRGRDIRHGLGTTAYEMLDLTGLALAHYHLGDIKGARQMSREALEGLQHVESAEDLVRAYHNHFVIMRDGSPGEAESAGHALARARELLEDRIARLDDPHARDEFIARVPLVREILGDVPGPTLGFVSPAEAK